MDSIEVINEHECEKMKKQNRILINQRQQANKKRWFFEIDIQNKIIANEIIYCPYCGELLESVKP